MSFESESATRPRKPVPSRGTWLQISILLIADLLVVFGSFLVAFLLRTNTPFLRPLGFELGTYLELWPVVFLWPLMMWREGLYPGFEWFGGDHLQRIATSTTLASFVMMAATFVTKTGPQYSRPLVVGFWLITLLALPLSRLVLRRMFHRLGLSGPPAVLLGGGRSAALIIRGLRGQMPPSLRPVAVFDDDPAKQRTKIAEVPVEGKIEDAKKWAQEHGVQVAIIAMPGLPLPSLMEIIAEQSTIFPRFLIVPNLFGLSTVEVDTRDISGTLTVEVRKNLLYAHNRALKLLTDWTFVIVFGALAIPVLAVISAAILVESGRPVFFTQGRVGRNGGIFRMWKFRSMVQNADRVLERHLRDSPWLRKEWQERQKLRDDPRITKVGSFLRRLSLDEMPQLWNIVRGEMRFVGPRPITEDQVDLYGPPFQLYAQVRPGLTGLWQVGGRAETTFQKRVELDTYYVRNWSIWLDFIIIVRTFWEVIRGRGAY